MGNLISKKPNKRWQGRTSNTWKESGKVRTLSESHDGREVSTSYLPADPLKEFLIEFDVRLGSLEEITYKGQRKLMFMATTTANSIDANDEEQIMQAYIEWVEAANQSFDLAYKFRNLVKVKCEESIKARFNDILSESANNENMQLKQLAPRRLRDHQRKKCTDWT